MEEQEDTFDDAAVYASYVETGYDEHAASVLSTVARFRAQLRGKAFIDREFGGRSGTAGDI
jgi:hypothetical protein